MDFDWKKTLPFIGAIATGNVPALVIAAANAIGEVTGNPVDASPDGIATAIAGATPDQLAALRKIDSDLKVKMREFDVKEREIDAGVEVKYVDDVKDARQSHAHTWGVLVLGYLINLSSYLCVAGILYGCFKVVDGTKMSIDPGLAAMVGSVIGAVVQWLMSNSSMANGFFFGSSPGSRQASSDLAKAVANFASRPTK
jgi:outer membrane lipoprotein SlyB